MMKPDESSTSRLNCSFFADEFETKTSTNFMEKGITSTNSSRIWMKMNLIEESRTLRRSPQDGENWTLISRETWIRKCNLIDIASPDLVNE
jgi:hypothetical protein